MTSTSTSKPVILSELIKLVHDGLSALVFHPDTLHSTNKLKVMFLGSQRGSRVTIIPSIQVIDQEDYQQEDAILKGSDSVPQCESLEEVSDCGLQPGHIDQGDSVDVLA